MLVANWPFPLSLLLLSSTIKCMKSRVIVSSDLEQQYSFPRTTALVKSATEINPGFKPSLFTSAEDSISEMECIFRTKNYLGACDLLQDWYSYKIASPNMMGGIAALWWHRNIETCNSSQDLEVMFKRAYIVHDPLFSTQILECLLMTQWHSIFLRLMMDLFVNPNDQTAKLIIFLGMTLQ